MIAVRYARNAAGKFAFDYTDFRTIWPVGHLTLLAHWDRAKEKQLRHSNTFDARVHAMVAIMAFCRVLVAQALLLAQRHEGFNLRTEGPVPQVASCEAFSMRGNDGGVLL
jgi:hypothetical protein